MFNRQEKNYQACCLTETQKKLIGAIQLESKKNEDLKFYDELHSV